MTASVGVATSGPDSDDPVQLIHDATTAMHAAKNLKPQQPPGVLGGICATAIAHASNSSNAFAEFAMAEHELQMVYQPIVELASGAVIGAEALIRWNHPELGLLMPDSFIGLAEDADLIIPPSNWILSQVCRTLAAWQCKGLNIQVGVNVSPLHFAAGTLATDVNSIIDSLGIGRGGWSSNSQSRNRCTTSTQCTTN